MHICTCIDTFYRIYQPDICSTLLPGHNQSLKRSCIYLDIFPQNFQLGMFVHTVYPKIDKYNRLFTGFYGI